MRYREFNFPIRFSESDQVFYDMQGNIFTFSKPGYNYIVYRLENMIDNKKAFKYLYDSDPGQWCVKANRLADRLKEGNKSGRGWEVSGKPLIAAYRGKEIFGLLTKYKDVSNLSVLDLVEKWGVVESVTDYSLIDTEFTLFLASGNLDLFEWGLAIRNGETGHTTFGYRVYFKTDDYTFTFPLESVRRHMSRVDEVESNLQSVFENVSEMQVWNIIENTKAANYAKYLTLKPEYAKLQDVFELFVDKHRTLDKLLFKLAKVKKEKGFKVVCERVMNEIFSLVKFIKE